MEYCRVILWEIDDFIEQLANEEREFLECND